MNSTNYASPDTARAEDPEAQSLFYLNLKTLDDLTIRIEHLSSSSTLAELRLEVERLTHVPPNRQRLIFNGGLLDDELSPLPPLGSYIHLSPSRERDANSPDEALELDDEADYYHSARSSAHVAQMVGFAWMMILYYSLVSWRLFMVIAFEQNNNDTKPHQSLEKELIPNFISSLIAIIVGIYGLHAASRNPNRPWRIKIYTLLLCLVAFITFATSLEMMDSNSVMAVFVIQTMFWYCILQARITERAVSVNSITIPNPVILAVPSTHLVQVQPSAPIQATT
jgi:hypothetical protein